MSICISTSISNPSANDLTKSSAFCKAPGSVVSLHVYKEENILDYIYLQNAFYYSKKSTHTNLTNYLFIVWNMKRIRSIKMQNKSEI